MKPRKAPTYVGTTRYSILGRFHGLASHFGTVPLFLDSLLLHRIFLADLRQAKLVGAFDSFSHGASMMRHG